MYFRKKNHTELFVINFKSFLLFIFFCAIFFHFGNLFYASFKEIKGRVFDIFTDSVNTRIRILLDSLEFFDSSLGENCLPLKTFRQFLSNSFIFQLFSQTVCVSSEQ